MGKRRDVPLIHLHLDVYQSHMNLNMRIWFRDTVLYRATSFHSARRPRTLSGRPTLGLYESFPDVFIRRGRRKDVASTLRPNRTYDLRSTDART